MSPLFRRSPEKVAQRAAADEEIQRIRALNRNELAVMLLPELSRDGLGHGQLVREQQLCEHLLRDFPDIGQLKPLDLLSSVRKALEALDDSGLAEFTTAVQRAPFWRITELGETALADGTVAERLDRR